MVAPVFGRRACSTFEFQSTSSKRKLKISPAPIPYVAIISNMAKSRLPGGCVRGMHLKSWRTSAQGNARGGRSAMRTRGATTHDAKSRRILPLVRRNRRNALSELHLLATVCRQ